MLCQCDFCWPHRIYRIYPNECTSLRSYVCLSFLPVHTCATATERRHVPPEHTSGPAGEAAGAPAHAVCPLPQTAPGL